MSVLVGHCEHCGRAIWWNGLVRFHDDPGEGDRCPVVAALPAGSPNDPEGAAG